MLLPCPIGAGPISEENTSRREKTHTGHGISTSKKIWMYHFHAKSEVLGPHPYVPTFMFPFSDEEDELAGSSGACHGVTLEGLIRCQVVGFMVLCFSSLSVFFDACIRLGGSSSPPKSFSDLGELKDQSW